MRKRYNTPHRSRVVKTRMTEEEYAEFAERLSACNMSQAEFIRQAITGAAIRPIITVSPVNDELLAAVGKLTAEYGRIGGNLNQIARTLNEWHSPYPQLAGEVRAAVSDLAALKFEVLQKVGDAIDAIRERKYRKKHEVTFSDLSPQEENQLYTCDKYFVNDEAEKSFFVAGKEITAKQLADALHSLPEEKRQAVLLYYFFDMKDAEIAELMKIPRSTVQFRRTSSFELLKRFLEESR